MQVDTIDQAAQLLGKRAGNLLTLGDVIFAADPSAAGAPPKGGRRRPPRSPISTV